VGSLLALPNGDLWIGFRGAISLLRNGNATNCTVHEGVPNGRVRGFAQDRAGTIWVATESGLARLEGNRWKEVVEDWNFPGKTAQAIFLDLREHFGSLLRTRWFFFQWAPGNFSRRVFAWARWHKSHKRQAGNYGWLKRRDPSIAASCARSVGKLSPRLCPRCSNFALFRCDVPVTAARHNPNATAALPRLNNGSTTFSMAGKPTPSSVS
jgi:hypothetical protein